MYGVIMFVIFGSGDLQPWAQVDQKKDPNNIEREISHENRPSDQ